MASTNGLQTNSLNVNTIDGLTAIYATSIYDNGIPINPSSYVPYIGATTLVDLNYQNVQNVNTLSTAYLLFTGTLNSITPITFSYLDATSSIQSQFATINTTLTNVPRLNGSNIFTNTNNFNVVGLTSIGGNLSNGQTIQCAIQNNQSGGWIASSHTSTSSTSTPDRVVIGYLSGYGATVGCHNYNLTQWGTLNLMGGNSSVQYTLTIGPSGTTFTGGLNGISPTVYNYLLGTTSNIQTQFNTINTTLSNVGLLNGTNVWTGASNTFNNQTYANQINCNTLASTTSNNLNLYASGAGTSIKFYINGTNNIIIDSTGLTATKIFTNTIATTSGFVLQQSSTTILTIIQTSTAMSFNIPSGNYYDYRISGNSYMTLGSNGMSLNGTANILYLGTLNFTDFINNISPTVFNYLLGTTSNIQTQFNTINTTLSNVGLLNGPNVWTGASNTFNNQLISGYNIYSSSTTVGHPVVGVSGGSADKLILFQGSSSNYPYSLGINGGELWYSVPTSAIHQWYINGVAIESLATSGSLTIHNVPTAFTYQIGGTYSYYANSNSHNWYIAGNVLLALSVSGGNDQLAFQRSTNNPCILMGSGNFIAYPSTNNAYIMGCLAGDMIFRTPNSIRFSTDSGASSNMSIVGTNVSIPSGTISIGTTTAKGFIHTSNYTSGGIWAITMTGNEFYQPTTYSSTDGIGLTIGVNRVGNRQMWVMDTALATNSTNTLISIAPGSGLINCLSTDLTLGKQLTLGNSSGIITGGSIVGTSNINMNLGNGIGAYGYCTNINNTNTLFGTSLFSSGNWSQGNYHVLTNSASTVANVAGLGLWGGTNCGIVALSPFVSWNALTITGGSVSMYLSGTYSCGLTSSGWSPASDVRVKKNIKSLKTSRSLERVLNARCCTYQRIFSPTDHGVIDDAILNKPLVGFIAQEVEQHNPHCLDTWIDKDSNEERFSLSYNDYIVHLCGAVQEQQKTIATMQQDIASLHLSLSQAITALNSLTNKISS